ncbi:hypothetical protein LOTGIDRAFT_234078 [Lottia gigantea]|uniref:Uncharacterized protein n=1 Tax=Lottia gigantea TaxID=225164 RepID=V4A008_LOTGI|nr:hypothetical protein LOTGIDRAFT_234078 [Lottia gigantea]ESO89972.1 hypothetical protein LOTGIDRAFT_234078 [Lottia gigantea]
MDYAINQHIQNSGEKVSHNHVDGKDSLEIKRPDKSKLDDLKEPVLKTFTELNIVNDTKPDQDVGQNGQAPGVAGEATTAMKSNYSISSTALEDESQTSPEEQISRSKVGTSVSCPGPEITEARAPMRLRSRFRIPKIHLPRTSFRQFRRSIPKHGQLVEEEISTPNSTLERNIEPITVEACPDISSDDRRRRHRLERLRNVWKGTKRSFPSCNCMRRRDRSQDYRPSGENDVRGLDGGRLELPSEFTSVANENAEVETRTDHG